LIEASIEHANNIRVIKRGKYPLFAPKAIYERAANDGRGEYLESRLLRDAHHVTLDQVHSPGSPGTQALDEEVRSNTRDLFLIWRCGTKCTGAPFIIRSLEESANALAKVRVWTPFGKHTLAVLRRKILKQMKERLQILPISRISIHGASLWQSNWTPEVIS
jgi:hypothetical protein